jgi:hypothetical protein
MSMTKIAGSGPHPDPLVRGMDPRIQIQIRTKMSWIRNTAQRYAFSKFTLFHSVQNYLIRICFEQKRIWKEGSAQIFCVNDYVVENKYNLLNKGVHPYFFYRLSCPPFLNRQEEILYLGPERLVSESGTKATPLLGCVILSVSYRNVSAALSLSK